MNKKNNFLRVKNFNWSLLFINLYLMDSYFLKSQTSCQLKIFVFEIGKHIIT